MLEITNLSASIEGKSVLTDISVTFEDGKSYTILGPNGSGKSTFSGAIIGRPDIALDPSSRIRWNGDSILDLSPDRRARLGIFVSFQSPPALPGVSIFSLLRFACPDRDPLETRRLVDEYARELRISTSLLGRGLYDGFSGGEKKKFETLLFALLRPKLALFDELDTGVDVDAQKTIAHFLKGHREPEQTFVHITHSAAFLDILPPDETIVLKDGAILKKGPGALARRILEEEGFEKGLSGSQSGG